MTETPTFGTIPQSSALREATIDSLGELMSRDPEGYSKQDLERVVAAMREQRERLAASAAAAPVKAPRAKAGGPPMSLKSSVAAGDIDL